ncbi:MAG: ABC transporter permease [Candidatus Falkowbacteria bacterium]
MSFIRIWAIFVRQLFLLYRNPTRLINIFLWATIDVFIWGLLTRYLDTIGQSAFSFTTVLFGAIILWELLVRAHQGSMLPFLEDVWTQNFINFFASPLKLGEYVAGLVLSSIFTSTIGFGGIALMAGLFFGFNILLLGFWLLPFLIILFIFGIALGIFTGGLIMRLGPAAEWIAWPISAIISPLVGIFYPISVLPSKVQYISHALPPTYVFEGMRQLVLAGQFTPKLLYPLAIGFGLSLVYLVAAYLFFAWVHKIALRRGLIARFGTETTT